MNQPKIADSHITNKVINRKTYHLDWLS